MIRIYNLMQGTALTVQTMFPSALSTISEAVPFLFPGIKDVFIKVKVKDLLFNGILLDCSAPDVGMYSFNL